MQEKKSGTSEPLNSELSFQNETCLVALTAGNPHKQTFQRNKDVTRSRYAESWTHDWRQMEIKLALDFERLQMMSNCSQKPWPKEPFGIDCDLEEF